MDFKKIHFDEIDSTNTYLEKLAINNETEGTVIIAKRQTNGRGQGNHQWISQEGGLYFSILLRPPKYLSLLSILTGVVVSETLREISNKDFMIKWPNDIIYEHKKIAGILVESKFKGSIPEYFIIGCGININQTNIVLDEKYQPVSLKNIVNKETDINEFLDLFLNKFSNIYQNYINDNNQIIIEKFLSYMYLKEEKVKINTYADKVIEGTIKGINADGALLIETDSKQEVIYSGRVIL